MSVLENLMLRDYPRYGDGVFLGFQKMRQDSETMIEDYNVDTPSLDTPLKVLSGGNIQKIILARELNGNPSLIIASHPTYGLDIGATERIRKILCDRRTQGAAVLLVSEDLDEILDLSDRIIVIYEGRIMREVSSDADISEIGLLMSGADVN
jgi:simple sugar transport system ATP-binding protein